jgi:Calpain family cysteine protease
MVGRRNNCCHVLSPRAGTLVATCLAWLALSASVWAAVKPTPPQSFAEVVRGHFAEWDRNGDGILSAVEIDRLVKNPSVTGMRAAAIGAIHRYLRGEIERSGVSERELMANSSAEPHRRDVDDHRPRFASDYKTFWRHLQTVPRSLFADSNEIALQGLSQGKLGDCFFVSTIGVAVQRNRYALKRMFHPRPDGSTDVAFANGRRVNVPPLTETEIALSSTAGEQGLWLNVLEKAFSSVMLKLPKPKFHHGDIDLDVISRGGKPAVAITLLTGHATTTTMIWKKKGKEWKAPSHRDLGALRERIHNLLSRRCAEGDLICAVTPPKAKLPPKIANHHVMAVLNYDPQRQIVHMWNPWGNTFTPENQPGLSNGYVTRQGRFDIPLADFVRCYRSVVAEYPEKNKRL